MDRNKVRGLFGKHMRMNLLINGAEINVNVPQGESLFTTIRSLGFHGVKFGSEDGKTGSHTVLMDGLQSTHH